jgi:hypothetical protein
MKSSLLPALLLSLCACGGSKDTRTLIDEGSRALNSGDYAAAARKLDEALVELGTDTSKPDWLRAQLLAVQARIHIDAVKAKDEFLALASAHPSKITPDHFSLIGGRLGDAGHLREAIAVLEAGMAAHSESPHLKALVSELGKKAETSGDSGALDSLKGLGYIGD